MENFDNIPSKSLKVEVTHLVNKLASNAGLYDSDDVLGALYVLRMKVQKSSQKRVLQLDEDRSLRKEGVTTRKKEVKALIKKIWKDNVLTDYGSSLGLHGDRRREIDSEIDKALNELIEAIKEGG